MALTAADARRLRSEALRDTVSELVQLDAARKLVAGMLSGLDIHYDLGEGHPLLGRRMPDLDLVTGDGPLRVFDLLHQARPVLVNLGAPGAVDAGAWADRVPLVDVACEGPWELPVLGAVDAPRGGARAARRPRGLGGRGGDGGIHALGTWFGSPS